MGQVSAQYGRPMAKLVLNQDVRAAWLPKRRRVFSLIIWVCIVGSFQIGTQDATKGMSGYPPHLAKENEHVIKGLGRQMWFEGPCRGLRQLGVEECQETAERDTANKRSLEFCASIVLIF